MASFDLAEVYALRQYGSIKGLRNSVRKLRFHGRFSPFLEATKINDLCGNIFPGIVATVIVMVTATEVAFAVVHLVAMVDLLKGNHGQQLTTAVAVNLMSKNDNN